MRGHERATLESSLNQKKLMANGLREKNILDRKRASQSPEAGVSRAFTGQEAANVVGGRDERGEGWRQVLQSLEGQGRVSEVLLDLRKVTGGFCRGVA